MWLDNTYIGWLVILVLELIFLIPFTFYCMERKSFFNLHFKNSVIKFLIISALLSPIILYISNFKNYSLSKEPADWGTFGDYIGGIYSVVLAVVLVYVTYTINRKNDELKECKRAIKEIYTMISKIDSQNIDINYIHKIIRCIDSNSLHLSNDISSKIINEIDYYICVAGDINMIDLKRERQIKDLIKRYYNGY